MSAEVADLALEFLRRRPVKTLDITGGAPELNAHFRRVVSATRALGVKVIDRCNLTVLEQPGQENTAEFLASEQVEIVASMPCYLEDNVNAQRGKGVFEASIRSLRQAQRAGLRPRGLGPHAQSGLQPARPVVAAPAGGARSRLQAHPRRAARRRVQFALHARQHADPAVRFNADLARHVRPISRAAPARPPGRQPRRRDVPQSHLGGLARICLRLRLQPDARPAADARRQARPPRPNSSPTDIENHPIRVAGHCFGCTAGQGSSCGGALKEAAE